MQVKELKNDGLNHALEITVTAQDIEKRVDSRLQEVGHNMSLPGFRKGKVPMPLLKQRYGKAIMGEVLELTVNETSAQALKDKDLRPAFRPKIEVVSFDDGKDLTYKLEVEVLPTFEIIDFKGLKLERPVSSPDAKMIDETLERIASSNPRTEPVTDGRKAQSGDTAVIDFDGRTADDNVRQPGMAGQGHHLKLGSGTFIPGFEDQLIGAKAGDKVEVKVTFPEEYGAQELAGRAAIFDVTVTELRAPGETKIDDEMAKAIGFDNLDAVKKAIVEQLQKDLDNQCRMVLKKSLLDILDEKHSFAVPTGMLDMEYNNIIQQLDMERKRQGEEGEMTHAEKDEFRAISERRVKLGLILAEIGNRNNIQVSDPELQRAVIAEAQKYPGQERQVFDYFAKNKHALEGLRAPLYEEKVVDFILALAEIKDTPMSREDLLKALEGDEDTDAKPKTKKKPAHPKKKS